MKTILIDLDGVLNEYKGIYDKNYISPTKEGTKDFLENISKIYDIKLFTTRNRLLASKWILDNELDKYISDITNVKEPAYLHIDDRCICFDGDFKKLFKEITDFKVWYK